MSSSDSNSPSSVRLDDQPRWEVRVVSSPTSGPTHYYFDRWTGRQCYSATELSGHMQAKQDIAPVSATTLGAASSPPSRS